VRRFDLRSLRFGNVSETWRELPVEVDPFTLGGEQYTVAGGVVDLRLDAARVGDRLTLKASLHTVMHGPCARCLEDVALALDAEAIDVVSHGDSEVDRGDEEEAYSRHFVLAADRWARDLVAGALPGKLVCRDDCRGLCPQCGANLNEEPDHQHAAVGEA
jgi:uncharacterized protein